MMWRSDAVSQERFCFGLGVAVAAMEEKAPGDAIVFDRLVRSSDKGSEDSSDVSSNSELAGERTAPVMAELISQGILDDDHMSAAQIQGLIRRSVLESQVALERQRQSSHEAEAASFIPVDTILSDCNLANFVELARRVDPLRAMTWMRRCPVTDHRMELPDLCVRLGLPVRNIPPQVTLLGGNVLPMTVVQCTQESCRRCEQGMGGYRFQWQGPWTCESANGPTPQEGRRRWMNCMNTRGCRACTRCRAPLPDEALVQTP